MEDKAEDREIDKQDKEIDKQIKEIGKVEDKEIEKVDKGIDRVDKDKEEVSQGTWIQVAPVGNCDRAGFAQFTICLFLVRGPAGCWQGLNRVVKLTNKVVRTCNI